MQAWLLLAELAYAAARFQQRAHQVHHRAASAVYCTAPLILHASSSLRLDIVALWKHRMTNRINKRQTTVPQVRVTGAQQQRTRK